VVGPHITSRTKEATMTPIIRPLIRELPQMRKIIPTMSPSNPRIDPKAIKNSIPPKKSSKKSNIGIMIIFYYCVFLKEKEEIFLFSLNVILSILRQREKIH
jgi:hypothetical protein